MRKYYGWILVLAMVAIVGSLAIIVGMRLYYPQKYAKQVEAAAQENQIPAGLIYAVIHTESGFQPDAVSDIGARGLMQITEETFEWARLRMNDSDTTYDDLFDPEVNIRYGAFLLRMLLDEFESPENAICAYYAGWGTVKNLLLDERYAPDGKTIKIIPFPGTAHYQYKVLRTWEQYRKLYEME